MLSREIALGVEKNINPPCFIFELLPLCQELFQFLQCFIITFFIETTPAWALSIFSSSVFTKFPLYHYEMFIFCLLYSARIYNSV